MSAGPRSLAYVEPATSEKTAIKSFRIVLKFKFLFPIALGEAGHFLAKLQTLR